MESAVLAVLKVLGGPLVGGFFSIVALIFGYRFGRAKMNVEIENLKAEKRKIEAATGLSTAEAAAIISQAAASIVEPLTERIKDLQESNLSLTRALSEVKEENMHLKAQVAELTAKINLLTGQV